MTEILAAQDTSIGPAGGRKNADVTAWVAVAAGALGAMLATLDISIVNSALPVIQGEIGATGAEGTWIATSFLVAEIVVIFLVDPNDESTVSDIFMSKILMPKAT